MSDKVEEARAGGEGSSYTRACPECGANLPAGVETCPACGARVPVDDGRRRALPGQDTFIRGEDEDDDGYDPFSDRRPAPEPLYEDDPWS
ncbi:MAG: zinc-ribbon domain-containing protein [Atopobiaceae bacterium]|jgi:rRNA maturation protein Nop10|nr:zinc-ribbon domain-containing protein [Atopobiaceae bacterium]MCI2173594.1 zinc-ribbon domain-containing protein [Atopobiaceae bacterium]MCI2207764.1 zinc-ribbon domain-containing protein [Atopobiaceae bacterium]